MSVRARRSIHLSLSLLAAAATLASGAVLAGASPRGADAHASRAMRVLDIGLERLHVPATWEVAVAAKVCDSHGKCRPMCGPGYDKRVYLSTFSPMLRCSLNFHRNSVWVVTRALSKGGTTTRRTSAFDGQTVILSIPSRAVTLFGFGKLGVRAVSELEPSTIGRLLARHGPTPGTTGWRRLSDGAVSLSVPPSWPVHYQVGNVVNPGVCGGSYFFHPTAFVGTGNVMPLCPYLSPATRADAMVSPVNGAWLAGPARGGSPTHLNALFASGTTTVDRWLHGEAFAITYPRSPNGSNAALVTVWSGGRPHYVVLGLGLSPTIADQILFSIRG